MFEVMKSIYKVAGSQEMKRLAKNCVFCYAGPNAVTRGAINKAMGLGRVSNSSL